MVNPGISLVARFVGSRSGFRCALVIIPVTGVEAAMPVRLTGVGCAGYRWSRGGGRGPSSACLMGEQDWQANVPCKANTTRGTAAGVRQRAALLSPLVFLTSCIR